MRKLRDNFIRIGEPGAQNRASPESKLFPVLNSEKLLPASRPAWCSSAGQTRPDPVHSPKSPIISRNLVEIVVPLAYNTDGSTPGEQEKSAMSVTATERKRNPGRYLLMAGREDGFIRLNEKAVARRTNPYRDSVDTAKPWPGEYCPPYPDRD
jgi:hypothetical protein